jgi:uncharacterized protein with FMN-binding domain
MRQSQSPFMFTLGRAIRKLFVSAFVIFTFVIYAVHQRLAGPAQSASASGLPATPQPTTSLDVPSSQPASPTPAPSDQGANAGSGQGAAPNAQPTVQTQAQVQATPTASGQYRDGQYTGPQVDAYYGWVQVQAIIVHGQISDVKFLQYPNHRRTSQEINNQAMPWLTQEAVQVQNANVDIITGATLTSQAFAQSLQAALQTATP